MAWKTYKSCSALVKPLSHTAVILVGDSIDISYLNNTLTSGDRVGKRLAFEVYLVNGHTNKLKSPVSAAKYLLGVFLRKNGSLGELGHQIFLTVLVVDQVCYIFVTLKEECVWRRPCA